MAQKLGCHKQRVLKLKLSDSGFRLPFTFDPLVCPPPLPPNTLAY